MWAAHNLERTGDRVINLCERVVYMVTGELDELNSDASGVESLT
jgi:phosphate transport system protein